MATNGRNWRHALLASALLPLLAVAGPPTFQSSSDASRLYSPAARQAQYESLQRVAAAEIEYGPFGRLRSINGRTGLAVNDVSRLTEGASAAAILEPLKSMLMATSLDALRVRKLVHAFGAWTIFMDQSIDGIPVIDAGLNVRVSETGEIILVSALFVPADPSASRKPQLSAEVAIRRLKEHLVASNAREIAVSPATEARLAYWTDQGQNETARLVWRVHASHLNEAGSREQVDYFMDAASGEVVYLQRQAFGLNRTT
jgi:Zn-dependent metalloprotease